jgi:pimeloyl-[acyl-carrier protein] methyl ester esterase
MKKPKLVLVHGWAMHAGIFDAFKEDLSAHFEVHALDLPGHGELNQLNFALDSCLAYLQDRVESFANADGCILAGWSLGGTLAMQLALRCEAIKGLIAIAAVPQFLRSDDWPHAVQAAMLDKLGSDLKTDWERVVERFLALEVFGSANEKAELRWLKERVFARGKPNVDALQNALDVLRNVNLRMHLTEITVPNLWIAGARDRLCFPFAMQSAAQLSKGQYVELTGAAHAPFLSHAQIMIEHMLSFSARVFR